MSETNIESEIIVLPINQGLKNAYLAILKEMYATQEDSFWMTELVDIISLDCGVTPETANEKFKQLSRFKLLKYISSSLTGHRYVVLVYVKTSTGDLIPIDSWSTFDKLIEKQLNGQVESDLTKIRRSVTTPGRHPTPALRDRKELELELQRLDSGKIILPEEDIISNNFISTCEISLSSVVQQLEDAEKQEKQKQKDSDSGLVVTYGD